ncbi:hypothetical protein UG54_15025 [Gordonia sihwensis]|nr:hypothetical protein UG54_15025 [Gordonia sihwensis]
MPEGVTELDVSQGSHRTVHCRRVSGGFEVVVDDEKPSEGTNWTTVIRVVKDDDAVRCLVENRMESANLTQHFSIGRPRLVHDMLELASKPTLGGSPLLTEPQPIPSNAVEILTDMLASPSRTLPIIVCSAPSDPEDSSWLDVAKQIATRTEGIAIVVTLDDAAVTAFKAQLGDLAIWGGGIRVYGPDPVAADSDGWRHRYYLRNRWQSARHATIDRIVYSVAQLSARRRVPDSFKVFDDQSASSDTGAVALAEVEQEREQWQFDYDLAIEERNDVEQELARARGHLARLKAALLVENRGDLLWGTQHDDGMSIPDEVQDTSEAVLAAQTYLTDWLAVPDSAVRDLEVFDTATESYNWGNTVWRGLRALAAYAHDRSDGWNKGGFWEWCASGPVDGWPATSKKLSMSEGEYVQTSEKLSRTRIFDVDAAVDSSGKMTMLAHLKISEGGGNHIPRVYFHDDTGGSTKKVHVGFVGPHYLVPNKSTN